MTKGIKTIEDKIIITSDMELKSGMHIGKSNDFAPIGAVDSIVITDPLTGQPIIPGSSIKGKMRTLLAKLLTNNNENGILPSHNDDDEKIKDLFGASNPVREAKLQFFDLFLTNAQELKQKPTDLLYTEIKFENTINRKDAVANPRQLERVPAGAKFAFKLVYNLENTQELKTDFEILAQAFKLLQLDYIGGSGSRGYGKVNFSNFKVEAKNLGVNKVDTSSVENILKESENYAV